LSEETNSTTEDKTKKTRSCGNKNKQQNIE